MSLFGNTNTGGSSLFGNNTQTSSAPSGGSLFGNTQQNNSTSGGGLFGSNTQQQNTGNTGGGLFGSSTTGTGSGGGGLFGGGQQQQSNTGGGSLFGGGGGSSLFGGNNQQQNNPNQGGSLFGNNNNNNTQNQTQQQNNGGSSLFGNAQQPQQQQQQQQQQNSLFQPTNSTTSGFNPLASGAAFPPGLSLTQQQDLARSRLQQAGLNASERGVLAQGNALVRKWDPNSQDTLLQAYLYNAVSAAYAPFYHPQPGEREEEWERALQDAPKIESEEAGGEQVRMVPVLVRGFKALGERVEYQANFVNNLRARLHEMNNSLSAIIHTHQQSITTSLEERRRQHAALRERTLRLSVKVQVLRNRGYALDAQEEALRKSLLALNTHVNDPSFSGREEEIWARLLALRERARWLEEETKRLGGVQDQAGGQDGGGSTVPDYVVQKTQKILKDYDGQLRHLGKELEEVKKEFGEWEAAQPARGGRR